MNYWTGFYQGRLECFIFYVLLAVIFSFSIRKDCLRPYIAFVCCRGGRYGEEDAKSIVVQILNVVAFCHLQGVVHRDLKPEVYSNKHNIYIIDVTLLLYMEWVDSFLHMQPTVSLCALCLIMLPTFFQLLYWLYILCRIFFLPQGMRMLRWRSLILVCLILLGQVMV